jgi:hypothetical protein
MAINLTATMFMTKRVILLLMSVLMELLLWHGFGTGDNSTPLYSAKQQLAKLF